MERGQHLPSLQKQNKPCGQEQPRGCRPSERGGWFLKRSPARAAPRHTAPPTPLGGFESSSPPTTTPQKLRERSGRRASACRRVGRGPAQQRFSRVVLRSLQIAPPTPGVLGGPRTSAGWKRCLIKADCGVFSLPWLLPGAPRGVRPPYALREWTLPALAAVRGSQAEPEL